MDTGYAIEVAVNLFLQSLGDWSYGIMKTISYLGQEEFFLVLMPFLYWCVDASLGLRIGLMLLLSTGINGFFKVLFAGPRPYWFEGSVEGVTGESSFGIPSGHAQIAASVWGYMAALFKKRAFTITAIVIIFLIGLSRLFLGVHFLRDVLIGWLIGALLVLLFVKLEPAFIKLVKKWSYPQKLAGILLGCALLMIIFLIPYWLRENYLLPQDWITNALADVPDVSPQPLSKDGVFTVIGTVLGMLLGYTWFTHKYGNFDTKGKFGVILLRFALGLAGVLLIWFGLGQVFPRSEDLVSYALRLFRYTLIGLWVSAIAPVIFILLRLANKPSKQSG
ncbi:MAG TPA: phosphatase PAP2 family protein [Anaerolineaceae bacterium]|nr:phosphatase PAP2 family protein [Anaerolineaceae bacterium]